MQMKKSFDWCGQPSPSVNSFFPSVPKNDQYTKLQNFFSPKVTADFPISKPFSPKYSSDHMKLKLVYQEIPTTQKNKIVQNRIQELHNKLALQSRQSPSLVSPDINLRDQIPKQDFEARARSRQRTL